MTDVDRWQLPDGIEEVLPAQAERVETLRRKLLDLYHGWGYQLVIPPLVEFTDSLLIGLGADLDLETFRLTDQLSGRMMGVRADIAPQVARIDAHSLAREGITRLCYAGSVLHTRPQTPMDTRSPIQVGAELYGDNSLAADCEIARLMIATLECVGAGSITLDLGHVGVYQSVLAAAALPAEQERAIFDALQRKSVPDLSLCADFLDEEIMQVILALADLHGDLGILSRARELLVNKVPAALEALDELKQVVDNLSAAVPGLEIYIDLAEMRGHHYHTGIVFAAYVPGHGKALANGGRYDDVGGVFGRARPATGFSADLKTLIGLNGEAAVDNGAIALPDDTDPALLAAAAELRAEGEVVIAALSGGIDSRCDRQLVKAGGHWVVRPLEND